MLAVLSGVFSRRIDIRRIVNDASIIPMELLVKRTLMLATMALSLYSMGPAMAESRLGDRQGLVAPHEAPERYQPIQSGHNLQPTEGELAKPDVSDADGKIVDELYRELMQEERARYPDLFRHPASGPADPSPASPGDPG